MTFMVRREKNPAKIRWADTMLSCMCVGSLAAFLVVDVKRERGDVEQELRRILRKGKDSAAAWVLLAALADNLEARK